MTPSRRLLTISAALAVCAVALAVRLNAVRLLPADYDEPVYLGVAQRYAAWLNAEDIRAIKDYEFNYEHPPLTKLAYAVAILRLPPAALLPERPSTTTSALPLMRDMPRPHFDVARRLAAAFGALQALILALLNPLAGLLLALSTWQIKYTSQIMLEPLPSLLSTIMVVCYVWGRNRLLPGTNRPQGSARRRPLLNGWLLLSAVAFGLTEASKFTYGVAGVAVLAHWLWSTRPEEFGPDWQFTRRKGSILLHWLAPVVLWALVSVVAFVASDPRMWSDPLGRLKASLMYHGAYTQSQTVRDANFPLWQPLVWLFQPVPWHPGVFYVSLDLVITLFAALGFRSLWRRQQVMALWLAIGLGFLLVWPTKWPQYILTITVPWTVAGAEGMRVALWEPLLRFARDRGGRRQRKPKDAASLRAARRDARLAVPWLLPGTLTLALLALFPLVFQAVVALTDFNLASIKDGMTGGVFRAVWEGITGQASAVGFDAARALSGQFRARTVNWAGPGLFLGILGGRAAEVLVFNVIWTLLSVALQAALGITAALLLGRRGVRFVTFWRTVLILPWAIPEFIGALVWMRIFEPRFGWLALATDLPWYISQPQWFQNPNATLIVLLLAATWYGFPLIMLAATAGLKMLPSEVYDAAAMDGAGGWLRFRYVTWPLLLPMVMPAIIIRMIFAFNQFYLFYTMQTQPPLITLATASFYYFEPLGYYGGQFAVSAAINVFTVLVLVILILWLDRRRTATAGVTYV